MLLLDADLHTCAADTFHTPRRREPSTQRETAWGVTYLDGAGPRRVEHNLKPLPPCLALATGKQRIPLWCVMYHDGTEPRRVKHNRSVTPAPRARIWNGADRDLRSQLVSSLRVFAGALQARRSIRIEIASWNIGKVRRNQRLMNCVWTAFKGKLLLQNCS